MGNVGIGIQWVILSKLYDSCSGNPKLSVHSFNVLSVSHISVPSVTKTVSSYSGSASSTDTQRFSRVYWTAHSKPVLKFLPQPRPFLLTQTMCSSADWMILSCWFMVVFLSLFPFSDFFKILFAVAHWADVA